MLWHDLPAFLVDESMNLVGLKLFKEKCNSSLGGCFWSLHAI